MMYAQNLFDDIRTFLPKYLSEEDAKKLFDELKNFPHNIDSRLYTSFLDDQDVVFQGDGFRNFTVVNLPDKVFMQAAVMNFSNTCDTDTKNNTPERTWAIRGGSLSEAADGLA